MLDKENEDFQTVFTPHKIGRLEKRKAPTESRHY